MSERARRVVQFVGVGLLAAGVGFGVRSVLPPFVLDDPFWRAFWSGPPVAGLFAVVAAGVAFFPAFWSALIARENAAREQWWKRAEWALGQAGSDKQTDREVANVALVALLKEATEAEGAMIYRTIENLQGEGGVDSQPGSAETSSRWRWLPWVK
jgi:hypothetical protein